MLVLGIAALFLQSCASFTPVNLGMNLGSKPVCMSSNINKEYTVVKHIKIKQKVPFLFLVRMKPDAGGVDLNELLAVDLNSSQADAVVNVCIKGEPAFGDVVLPVAIGLLTGLMFPPFFLLATVPMFEDLKTYEVEGDVVRYVYHDKSLPVELPIDPNTGQPVKPAALKFDPVTGLPIKTP